MQIDTSSQSWCHGFHFGSFLLCYLLHLIFAATILAPDGCVTGLFLVLFSSGSFISPIFIALHAATYCTEIRFLAQIYIRPRPLALDADYLLRPTLHRSDTYWIGSNTYWIRISPLFLQFDTGSQSWCTTIWYWFTVRAPLLIGLEWFVFDADNCTITSLPGRNTYCIWLKHNLILAGFQVAGPFYSSVASTPFLRPAIRLVHD